MLLRAVDDVYTLELYRSKTKFSAGPGTNGGRNNRMGARGEDLVLLVPAGTHVVDAESGDFLADLTEPGDEVAVAFGGRGGWGNKRFATSTNQAPNYAQKGHPGDEVSLRLELRLLADVGLVGLPNAGKSTLLAAISNAKPKIASYPFTTLEPMLGVVNVNWDRFTLADLPGLVEGASEGYGLGFEFLKHIRRCRVLLHVVDCSSPDPVTDYELIETELQAYDATLDQVARVVAVTKADLDMETARTAAQTLEQHLGREVQIVSAEDGTGLEQLGALLFELVKAEKERAAEEADEEVVVLRPGGAERFTVEQAGKGRYVIEGKGPVTFVEMMDVEDENARFEVYRRMERWGIAKALRRAGAKTGDIIVFGAVEMKWGE